MKEHNEFDELARRKLAERQFAFQEAHWNDMEKMLDAGGRRRRWAGWWLFPALLLLIGGGGAFLYFSNDVQEQQVLSATQDLPSEKKGANITKPAAEPINNGTAALKNEVPATSIEEEISIEQKSGDPIASIEEPLTLNSPDQKSNDISNVDRNDKELNGSEDIKTSQEGSVEVDRIHGRTEMPAQDRSDANVLVSDPQKDPISPNSEQENDRTGTGIDPIEDVTSEEDPMASTDSKTVEAVPDDMVGSEEGSVDLDSEVTEAENTVNNDSIGSEDRTGNIAENKDHHPIENEDPVPLQDPQPDDVSIDPPAPIDSIATSDPAPSDTLITPEPQAAPTPIVDPRSPFEIGVHAGILLTSSTYSGPQSEGQFRSIDQQQNYAGGIEFMRMGRNVGVGSGIHFSTYSERITMEHIDRTENTQSHYYFLTPVDTTLLIITDSIEVNGIMQYTGQSVYTTVHVLDQAMQTITTTTRLREAREQLNRTSYLEIPLLFDAHVVQGRWNLGLRGGPTLGILSSSSGSIPNTTYDGYLDLNDQQFRSLVLGYTGRVYVRYRFNAAWSIGLEPSIRGHFQNGFESEELMRRPIGYGGMFSLNYRFR